MYNKQKPFLYRDYFQPVSIYLKIIYLDGKERILSDVVSWKIDRSFLTIKTSEIVCFNTTVNSTYSIDNTTVSCFYEIDPVSGERSVL